jgi:hypothetical protein
MALNQESGVRSQELQNCGAIAAPKGYLDRSESL